VKHSRSNKVEKYIFNILSITSIYLYLINK
jgi:hypothetical protein